ncbi:MAG: BTAD domain-containing putative transcriptional regulator, partial [Actinomycetota bacterium]
MDLVSPSTSEARSLSKMRFRVLGPIEVIGEDGPLPIRGKERTVLALLAMHVGQVVTTEALIKALWDEDPPRTAEKTLHAYIARLRKTLEPQRKPGAPAELIVTSGGGYRLRSSPEDVDAHRFESLAAAGRDQLQRGAASLAAATLRRSLSLWNGAPYQDLVPTEVFVREIDRLENLRLEALEARIDADIRLGRARDVVAELEALLRDQPLREHLWALLLVALYRVDRQGDALDAYQRARVALADELGIDPGPELQRLQSAILSQDPDLETEWSPSPLPLPPELDVVTPMSGRHAEHAWLLSAMGRANHGRGDVALIEGPSGIGKTRLCAELARDAYEAGALVLYGAVDHEISGTVALERALALCGISLADLEGDSQPGQIGRKIAEHLKALAPDQPVLIIMDNIDRANRELFATLADLAHAIRDQAALLVVGYDSEAGSSRLWSFVDHVDPQRSRRVMLGPLSGDDVIQIVELYTGKEDAIAAAPSIEAQSEGVPARVHEMATTYARSLAADRIKAAEKDARLSRAGLALVEDRLARSIGDLRSIDDAHKVVTRAPAESSDPHPRPYKGLVTFEREDRDFFFGRERLVADLAARLAGARVLAIVGPSGSGKSSLVKAGLLPALADGLLPRFADCVHVLMRPGNDPKEELERGLRAAGVSPSDGDDPADLLTSLGPCLLFVDQFEELFTLCDVLPREEFIAGIVQMIEGSHEQLVIVLAIRSDFYGRLGMHPELARAVSRQNALVGPMQPDELHRAIELPALRAAARVEDSLTNTLVADVLGRPGALPLLSACLAELWDHRSDPLLRRADLMEIGGVRGSVARLAERSFQELGADDRRIMRQILSRLIVGEGDEAVRRRASISEFDVDTDATSGRVLATLADRRLVTIDDGFVEIAHEAVIREWPRLKVWLEEDAQRRKLHLHLTRAAADWEADGRDPSGLYRGARLATLSEWLGTEPQGILNELERAFVHESKQQEQAEQRQKARGLRRAVAGLTVGVAALAILVILALSQAHRATDQGRLASSRGIAAEATNQISIDPQLSLLLALKAYQTAPTAEAEAAVRRAVVESHLIALLPGDAGEPFAQAEFGPGGKILATGGPDG